MASPFHPRGNSTTTTSTMTTATSTTATTRETA